MNMIEAVKSVLTQFFGFSGRARRSEFWYWYLATIIVAIILAGLEAAAGLSNDGNGPISTVFSLAIFIPGLAVTFRRLHDTGRTGWWIGGFYLGLFAFGFLITVMAIGIAGFSGTEGGGVAYLGVLLIVFVLAVLIYAIAMLVFLCQDSQSGPNKYGSNPKDEGNFDIFS